MTDKTQSLADRLEWKHCHDNPPNKDCGCWVYEPDEFDGEGWCGHWAYTNGSWGSAPTFDPYMPSKNAVWIELPDYPHGFAPQIAALRQQEQVPDHLKLPSKDALEVLAKSYENHGGSMPFDGRLIPNQWLLDERGRLEKVAFDLEEKNRQLSAQVDSLQKELDAALKDRGSMYRAVQSERDELQKELDAANERVKWLEENYVHQDVLFNLEDERDELRSENQRILGNVEAAAEIDALINGNRHSFQAMRADCPGADPNNCCRCGMPKQHEIHQSPLGGLIGGGDAEATDKG